MLICVHPWLNCLFQVHPPSSMAWNRGKREGKIKIALLESEERMKGSKWAKPQD